MQIGTRELARLLGIRPENLTRAVWNLRIPAPVKGPGGCYLWNVEDIRRAARAFGLPMPEVPDVQAGQEVSPRVVA